MVSQDSVYNAFGIVENVVALLLFLSPVPTFMRIVTEGAVEDFSSLPYLATFFNCGIWILYSLPVVHPHTVLGLSVNSIGLVLHTVYLIIFMYYSPLDQRIKVLRIMLAELVFLGVLATLTLTLADTIKVRSIIVKSVAIVSSIMMYAAPLGITTLVTTTKTLDFMPFFLSLFLFLHGMIGAIYHRIHLDLYIFIPSILGSLLGIAQLVLYATYHEAGMAPNPTVVVAT